MSEIEIRRRPMDGRLRYLAGKLRESEEYRIPVSIALEVLADELGDGDA